MYKKITGFCTIGIVGLTMFLGCSEEWDKGLLKCSNETALEIVQERYKEMASDFINQIKRSGVPLEQADEWRYNVAKNENENKISEFLNLPQGVKYSTKLVEKSALNFSNFLTTTINKDIRRRFCEATVSGNLNLGKYGSIILNDVDIGYSLQPTDDDAKVFVWMQKIF